MIVQILLLLCIQQSGHALQLIAPLSHQTRIGEDVTIPCSFTINNPPINRKFLAISWYFQGKEILSVQNTNVRQRDPRVSYTARAEDGIAGLSMSNVTIMDGGIYKCSVLYTTKKEEKEIRLDIQAPPKINITDRVVVKNKESSVHGVISGFYPVDIDIKWLRDGEILNNVIMEKPQRGPDGTYSVRSSITITPTEEDRKRTFSCRVQHESLTAPLQEDFQLVYGDLPSVHITSKAFKLNVQQMLVCSVYGFYPESIAVNWFLNETRLEKAKTRRISSSAVESIYHFIPTEQNWGMELRCVVEHGTLTTPHEQRLLVQATDMKAQYKLHTVIASVVLVSVSGVVTIVLLLIKQRNKRLPKVRKITRCPGGIFSLGVDHFYPENITVYWEVIQPPSNTKPRSIGSTLTMHLNQNGTFNASSSCESLRGEIWEDEPYIVRAVVEHNKLKQPAYREWRSDDQNNKDFLAQPDVEMIQIPKLFINGQTKLQCKISNFYPNNLTSSWFKRENGKMELNRVAYSGKYKNLNSKPVQQSDKTFTSIARLEFITTLEDQGSEFICRVSHPSLEEPIERTTGPLQVLEKPKAQRPIQLHINDPGDMVATFNLFSFYPQAIKVTWMCAPNQEKKTSEETISENPDGTFTVTTQCTIPGNLFKNPEFRVRLTWDHPSMEKPEYREISVQDQDFLWHPKFEGITPIILQVQKTSTVRCTISGYFPENLRVTWLEKKGETLTDCTQNRKYCISDIRHDRMADNSYQCSLSLSFTPISANEDLEIICRAEHPSLEHPIEQSTGSATASVAPQQQKDVTLTLRGSDQVLCSLSLLKFYPQSINITWTCGEYTTNTLGSTKKVIQTNDEKIFDAISECIIPWNYFRSSVCVTWKHDSLNKPGSRDLRITDFPWHPVIEQVEKPKLLVNTKAILQYKISHYFPNDLTVTWYKKEKGKLCALSAPTYKQNTTSAQLQPDNTYSCTASLQFTPSLPEDQWSEFICRVEHPSLKHPVERSTGPLEVFETAVDVDPIRLTLCPSGDVLCSVHLKVFSKNIHLSWTSGGQQFTQLPSNKFLLEDDEGKMFSVISECRIPWDDFKFPIRFVWEHGSTPKPECRELKRSDLPWLPQIEIVGTPYLHCGIEAKIEYKISGYFPDNLLVSWHKKLGTDNFVPLEDFKRYEKDITNSRRASDYTFSCIASLVFTPSMTEDHLADFMCEVWQPHLEKTIEKTTGRTPVICLQCPRVDTLDTSALVLNTECEIQCKMSGYFPDNLTVAWYKKSPKKELITSKEKYNIPELTHELQPDKTYSCTARLRFTPLQKEEERSEFICRVEHPSLDKPIQIHTGPLRIKEMQVSSSRQKEK